MDAGQEIKMLIHILNMLFFLKKEKTYKVSI